MTALLRIRIDDRERDCEVVACLRRHTQVAYEVARLRTGDYAVEGLVVERKTLPDFAASILDGRLFRQMERLAACARPLLILEGGRADLRLSREALQGALITVSLIYGIPVLRASDGRETAHLILLAARQLQRAAAGVRRRGARPKGKRAAQLRLLQGLPRIGPGRAAALLNSFPTVLETFQADEAALVSVEGIGPKIAKGIHWTVRETPDPYRSSHPLHPC